MSVTHSASLASVVRMLTLALAAAACVPVASAQTESVAQSPKLSPPINSSCRTPVRRAPRNSPQASSHSPMRAAGRCGNSHSE